MDLQAMRGGILDWRRAEALLEKLPSAEAAYEDRCSNAARVATMLATHPRVSQVFHPSLQDHVDSETIASHYKLPGSLLSFRLEGADEDATKHFCDVLATCVILRYALSFDGLTTKLNHHGTVSEYFTPPEELGRLGIARSTFYCWYQRYLSGGFDALEDRKPRQRAGWNQIPKRVRKQILQLALEQTDLSPRELACRFTDEKRYARV
jgi:hypothetical protein